MEQCYIIIFTNIALSANIHCKIKLTPNQKPESENKIF